jgi:outer membrane protein OmpA-like peptidoglycan-associated protein
MHHQSGNAEPYALGLAALVAAVVVASVVVVGLSQDHRVIPSVRPAQLGQRPVEIRWPQKIVFADNSDQIHVPESAQEALSLVTEKARATRGIKVQIVAVHPADQAGSKTEQSLALQRAEAVRHALEANGVGPSQMIVTRPTVLPPTPHQPGQHRIELSLQ